jgi:hypothetical protein
MRPLATVAAGLAAALLPTLASGQGSTAPQEGAAMTTPLRATGSFDVQIRPLADEEQPGGTRLGRMAIDKQYHGDLEGTGKGEMLTAMTGVEGSGAYVAIERVAGTLAGRRGSFVLHHRGVMVRGSQQLSLLVVPDSGTEELVGITGEMAIRITDGAHLYDFDYTLPPAP